MVCNFPEGLFVLLQILNKNAMKTKTILLTLLAFITLELNLNAQDLQVETKSHRDGSDIALAPDTIKITKKDTTIVRIGKKDVKVIENENGTEIIYSKNKSRKTNKFKGHWDGLEIGFNSFGNTDYSMYAAADNDFMSLNQGKSTEINLNFFEQNIGLYKSYVGLVSGLGLSFNNYRFDKPYTLTEGANRTEPLLLVEDNLSKTKLAVSYLTVPLLVEFQIPVNQNEGRMFINAGLVGGVKLGSHTKIKYNGDKDKDRSGFNINSFKYAATARIGYKDVALFASYNLNSFFKAGKGPDLTPFTIGISFMD